MTDIGTVGFAADTKGLVELQNELDRAKEKADRLNESFKQLKASGQDSGPAFTQAKAATAEYETALGNLVSKQLEVKGATAAMETIVKNTNMTWGQAAAAINQAQAANTAYSAAAKGSAAAHAEMNAAGKESSGIFSGLANMLGLTGGAMVSNAGHAATMTAAHHGSTAATHALREAMHILEPQLEALGIKMGSVTAMSGAMRAGIAAFAATIAGTVVLEMAKSADVIEQTRNRLEGLAGASMGTQLHEGLKALAGDLGKVAYSMEPALESIVKMKQEIGSGDPHVKFLDGIKVNADQVKEALGALWEQMRMGGASEDAATAGINKFFESVKKAGGVTGDIFRELEHTAPEAAEHIARALTNNFKNGITNVTEFEHALDKVPLSLNGILTVLQRMSGATKEAFEAWKKDPKTVAEAVTMLKNSFDELWKSGSGGNDFNQSVRTALKTIAGDLDSLKKAIDDFRAGVENDTWAGVLVKGLVGVGEGFKSIGEAVEIGITAFGKITAAIGTFVMDGFQALADFGNKVVAGAKETWSQFSSVISEGVGSGLSAIANFINDAISKLGQLASKALEVARSVAGAIADMFKGGGGNASGAGGSNPGSTDANGSVGGGTGGASDSGDNSSGSGSSSGTVTGGDAGTIDMGDLGGGTGGITDAFATGGGFTVGGDGGTDSTLVAFMATKGENVDVYHGDKPASTMETIAASTGGGGSVVGTGSGSNVVDLMSARFARSISEQTIAIDDAMNDGDNKIVTAVNNLGVLISNINFGGSGSSTGSGTATKASGLPGTPATPTTTSPDTSTLGSGLFAGASIRGGAAGKQITGGGFSTASGKGMGDEYEKKKKADEAKQEQEQKQADQIAQQAAQQAARQAAAPSSGSRSATPAKAKPSDYAQTAGMPGTDVNGLPNAQRAPYPRGEDPMNPTPPPTYPAGEDPMNPGSSYPPGEDPMSPSGLPYPQGSDPMTAGQSLGEQVAGDLSKLGETNDQLGNANEHLSDANSTLEDIRNATNNFGDSVDSGANQTTSAIDSAASEIASAVGNLGQQIAGDLSTLGENFAGGMSDLANGSSGSGSSGGGGFRSKSSPNQQQSQDQNTNRRYGGGDSGGDSGGSSSGGQFYGPFDYTHDSIPYTDPGTPWGPDTTGSGVNQGTTTGSSVGDVAGGYMDSGGSSYTSTTGWGDVGAATVSAGTPDVGGSGFAGGGYAEGGSFVVGGDGGQDTTKVSFMATKGETVTISNDNIPGGGDGAVYAGAFATGGQFEVPGSGSTDSTAIMMRATKGEIVSIETPDQRDQGRGGNAVSIIVQPGVQADDFIRSRAQIRRVMG